jgi:hypothetical protein
MVGAQPGEAGVHLLQAEMTVRFRIKVEREAYVGVWSINADGTIYQLFPNDQERDARFKAKEVREVPSPDSELDVVAQLSSVPQGIDRVWVEASTERSASVNGKRVGPFVQFQTEQSRGAWAQQRVQLRNLELKPRAKLGLAEQVLKYHVRPGP